MKSRLNWREIEWAEIYVATDPEGNVWSICQTDFPYVDGKNFEIKLDNVKDKRRHYDFPRFCNFNQAKDWVNKNYNDCDKYYFEVKTDQWRDA